jgi:hypothetical protein
MTFAAEVIMVYDAKADDPGQGVLDADGALWVTRAAGLRENLDIRAIPYAVMTTPAGVVTGHGLVNNASHLESLLEHWEASRAEGRARPREALQATEG